MFGISSIKGRYKMIVKYIVPLLRGVFKNRYGAFVYQLCQLGGVLMLIIGATALLGHWTKQEGMYRYDWLGNDVGIALGTSLALIIGGIVFFFMVLLIDDKIDKLDKKYEDKFSKLNDK